MDEAEKYKQRLEAIAEKRRLQEEEDRARREMEDEKLRLQQLKRKSLRDQWLMEGAPLSPTSLDTLSSRSPLWGFQAQEEEEVNQDTQRLRSESQQLAEEKDKLKVQMEDGQTKTETLAEAEKEKAQNDIVQNGENNAAAAESSEDDVKTSQSPLLNNTATLLTNGTKELEANVNHSDSRPSAQSTTNGPVCFTEGGASIKLEAGLSLGASEAEPGLTANAGVNEEEEEDEETVVMRAERVIVTDEGDDASENLSPHEGQKDTERSEAGPAEEQEEEPVEGVRTKTEMFTQPGETEATESIMEAQPVSADDTNTNENSGGESKDDGQAKPSASATVAPVPVHSEDQPRSLSPEAEQEAAVSPERPAAAGNVLPGQFEEVPLTHPQENQKSEAAVGEQEPLLLQTRAQAATEAATIPVSTGAVHGEEAKAARHKTCQCCSIM